MIITISGMPGAGKNTIAELLAKKLNLKHYSLGDIMGRMATERGMTLEQLSVKAEKDPTIDKELDERQMQLGKEDNFVLDSRLGYHFIPQSIKIFLDVDIEQGANRIFKDPRPDEKDYSSKKDLIKGIKMRISSEKTRYENYYGLNHLDKNNYDIIIDTTNLSPEQVVTEILDKIRKL
jgi:predicted cytidylate kinase